MTVARTCIGQLSQRHASNFLDVVARTPAEDSASVSKLLFNAQLCAAAMGSASRSRKEIIQDTVP